MWPLLSASVMEGIMVDLAGLVVVVGVSSRATEWEESGRSSIKISTWALLDILHTRPRQQFSGTFEEKNGPYICIEIVSPSLSEIQNVRNQSLEGDPLL